MAETMVMTLRDKPDNAGSMVQITTRFAPSPTGFLHLGHACSAIFSHDFARLQGGQFILRIEDIDRGRCRLEFEQALLEDLTWLGLTWRLPVRRQSECMTDYASALGILEEKRLLYPCFCTRREILDQVTASGQAPHGSKEWVYPGTCRSLTPSVRHDRMMGGEVFSLRLDLSRALAMTGALSWFDERQGWVRVDLAGVGDVVLARKDVPASYHLAVTVDDHLQGVTHVTRGEDLFASTHIHRLLQALLGLDTPKYRHHPLLTDSQGKRLAKRDGAVSLRQLRQKGVDPETVRRQANDWFNLMPLGQKNKVNPPEP
ncbi:MAG: Glutamyl-tRNA synthetase [Magnetococcales bacterium]|nr:Glutamyl-tRNA synthetase [Magnetococcales bacterium]